MNMDRTLRTYRRVCHLNAPDFSVIDTQCRALTVVYGLDRKSSVPHVVHVKVCARKRQLSQPFS